MRKPMVKITDKPISINRTLEAVADPRAGGTVLFMGTVRNISKGIAVNRLRVETAKGLAKADLVRMAKAAAEKFDVIGISVVHRTGKLRVGDIIVAIAVSAPHRKHAFSACGFLIDELKKTTPIWKKEFGSGSEWWVNGEG